MSFMGKVYEILGFENTESEPKKKQKKEKPVKASYNFKRKKKNQKVNNIDGVPVVYPEVFEDAKDYVEYIKKEEPLIVSIEECQREEVEKILAYLQGATEMVNGKVKCLEKERYYVVLSEDMDIEEN